MKKDRLHFNFQPYTLKLKHPFGIASNTRTTTPVVLTELKWNGITGYGEASMPPYLGESHDTVLNFLSKLKLGDFIDPFDMEGILSYVDNVEKGNTAAKASVDIALHDLTGKLIGQPWYKIWGYDAGKTPYVSYTIGIDTPEIIRKKTEKAAGFKILKVKLGRDTDKQLIETIREVTDVPICVDVNQGWTDKHQALEMIYWLHERNVLFVEQPMPKNLIDDTAWLTEQSPLPVIADESVQRLSDIIGLRGVFSGINIKLMKCTGMREAHKMLELACALDMKIMVGCMTETSCAISAAAQLSPMTDWADLDGALLIKNDVYKGVQIINGKITLSQKPGLGLEKIPEASIR
jgi:L-alanine-DL-glutamate epimerase-like enolase superfamily enzyme